MIALIRPDDWDFPLFLHVLGATFLFGGVATVTLLAFASRGVPVHATLLRRLAFTTLVAVVWPAYVVMRIGAEWIFSKEKLDTDTPDWAGVGYLVADGGIILLLVLTVLGWLALRRKPKVIAYFGGLAGIYLVALVVAWWAMTAKPGS